MSEPTLLILAAGMGSRYGGLKQLDRVGPSGETIIDYSVFDARRAGFGKIVFVIRRDIEQAFREHIGHRVAEDIAIDYAYQELDDLPDGFTPPSERVKPWGTGHAVLAARDVIDEPFAVITADDFYGAEAHAAAAAYLRGAEDTDRADYCMAGYRLANTLSEFGGVSRGICRCDDDGRLDHVVETLGIEQREGRIHADDPHSDGHRISLTGDEIVSMTLWGFTPSIFGYLDSMFTEFLEARGGEAKSEFYLPFVVNKLIRTEQARVKVLDCNATWFGVTFRQDKPFVQQRIAELVEAGDYPSPLKQPNTGNPSNDTTV